MSTDPKQYAPLITQNLDFATMEAYLLKHGVLSVVEYDRFHKALQSGSSTNGDVVHQILPRILKKAREFYRALRDHVNDKPEDVHPSNNELFYRLPENFGKGKLKRTLSKLRPTKNKPSVSTITEDPVSSSDNDKRYEYRRSSSYNEDDISTDGEGELESELVASHPPFKSSRSRMAKSTSTHSLQCIPTQPIQIPPGKKKNITLRQQSSVGDDNTSISIGKSPSITSLPATLDQYGSLEEIEDDQFKQLLELKYVYKELYMKEKNENKIKEELEILKAENITIKEKNEKLTKEKEFGDGILKQAREEASSFKNQLEEANIAKEQVIEEASSLRKQFEETKITKEQAKEEASSLRKQLEETIIAKEQAIEEANSLKKQLEEIKIAKVKELNDIGTKLNEEKNSSITKEKEYQNLIKENERLQSKYEAAKKHNHILLDENSRVHSAMQELQDTQEEVSQLREHIQKTKACFEQISQEFIQKFQLLKQKVEDNIMLKVKANQDCSTLMLEYNKLTRKVNNVLSENRCLKGN